MSEAKLFGRLDRRKAGRAAGATIIAATLVTVVLAVRNEDRNPQTDDATVRANFIGVAPEVSGNIVELQVADNQIVHEGDLLFVVDPKPFEIALARARAALALTHKDVDALTQNISTADAAIESAKARVAASSAEVSARETDPVATDARIARLEQTRAAAEADVVKAETELKTSDDHLARLEAMLAKQFATKDLVEEARTRRDIAAQQVNVSHAALRAASAAVDEARANRQATVAGVDATRAMHEATLGALAQARSERARAEDAVGQVGDLNARVEAAEQAVRQAELDLEHTRVSAKFDGRVVNLNISVGAFARAGAEVFTIVDTRAWYVMANFRETQLKQIAEGDEVEIYLQSQPGRRYRGKVVGLGWAVLPDQGTSVMGLPRVDREIDWVRLAQRFPVRVLVDDPDDAFRVGASAVATVHGGTASTAKRAGN
jgi:multidrug efflux system membrane fusion protein